MREFDDNDGSEDLEPSKSEMKRRMTALQQIGESLVQLSDRQLAKIPIDDSRLIEAIREARGIKSNSARRRHMQYIGKLMRDIGADPIRAALDAMDNEKQKSNATFHALEKLRDDVLAAGLDGIELVIARWENADRQHLRQLILQHRREIEQQKPAAASRKLFKYLRGLAEQDSSPS